MLRIVRLDFQVQLVVQDIEVIVIVTRAVEDAEDIASTTCVTARTVLRVVGARYADVGFATITTTASAERPLVPTLTQPVRTTVKRAWTRLRPAASV
jgi:hypothetical protein